MDTGPISPELRLETEFIRSLVLGSLLVKTFQNLERYDADKSENTMESNRSHLEKTTHCMAAFL